MHTQHLCITVSRPQYR